MRQGMSAQRTWTFTGLTEEGLEKTARATAQTLVPRTGLPHDGLRIFLHGGLGAGKTTWVRFFLRALGIMGRVKSPSFSLLETYEHQNKAIHHLDFYRQTNPKAWQEGGFRDIMAEPGIILVEWPEHAAGLPPPHMDLWLDWTIENQADGPRSLRVYVPLAPAPSETMVSETDLMNWNQQLIKDGVLADD